MNKHLIHCLKRTIKQEFVSVYHNYDEQKTVYTIPYNALLTPRNVKLQLLRVMGMVDDDKELDASEIDSLSHEMASGDLSPEFELEYGQIMNKRGTLMVRYILDFDGAILFEKSYPSNKVYPKNPILKLIRLCSNKIIEQERTAQKYKMEKILLSSNLFNLNAQHGRK